MAEDALPADAPMSEIAARIREPEEYFRRVLENMRANKLHGGASVRFSLSGDGLCPPYRIGALKDGGPVGADHEDAKDEVFFSSSHKSVGSRHRDIKNAHWSDGGMRFDEVSALLGKLRGFTKLAPKVAPKKETKRRQWFDD